MFWHEPARTPVCPACLCTNMSWHEQQVLARAPGWRACQAVDWPACLGTSTACLAQAHGSACQGTNTSQRVVLAPACLGTSTGTNTKLVACLGTTAACLGNSARLATCFVTASTSWHVGTNTRLAALLGTNSRPVACLGTSNRSWHEHQAGQHVRL